MLHPGRISNHRATIFLLIILFLTAGLRSWLITNKNSLEYDESISYLAVTCRQIDFSAEEFTAYPRPAAYWKTYFEVKRPFCFQEISRGLAKTDIHPPFYFWLLHLWSLIWGVHLWTGPTLNVMITMLTTFALYKFAKTVWQNRRDALLVTFTFALNPSVLLISQEARQYDLLALWSVLLVWQTSNAIKNKGLWTGRQFVLFAFTVAAGMLTHYDFSIPVAGSALLVLFTLIKHDRQRVTAVWSGLGIGFLFAIILHPYLFSSVQTVADRASDISWPSLLLRIEKIGEGLVGFIYLLIPLAILPIYRFSTRNKPRRSIDSIQYFPFFFLMWNTSIIVLRYLLFLVPTHAMGPPKYLTMTWPLLSFLPPLLRMVMSKWRTLSLYLYAIPLLIGGMLPFLLGTMRAENPNKILAPYELVIADNTSRGIVLPIIWYLPDRSEIILSNQDILQEKITANWLPSESEVLWIHKSTDNQREKHEELLKTMTNSDYNVQQLPINLSSLTTKFTLYLVTR